MITEDYVSSEIAKLLKEKGFREWCSHCYGVDVRHKGESIDFDEECELKNVGLGDELEYVDGGMFYNYWCDNRSEAAVYAAPTLQMAMKWLNEVHHILVVSDYEYECTDTSWYYKIYKLVDEHGKCKSWPVNTVRYIDGLEVELTVAFRDYMRSYKDYATKKEADEEGIRYVLENLI